MTDKRSNASLTFMRFARPGTAADKGLSAMDQIYLHYDGKQQKEMVFGSTVHALLFAREANIVTFVPPRNDRHETKMKWHLLDAEERHRGSPSTFQIPSYTERNAVLSGDFVKLIFESENGIERMWVKVLSPGFGTLDNQPMLTPMDCGDPVRFKACHICDITRKDAS